MTELSAPQRARGRGGADNPAWGWRQIALAALVVAVALLAMWRIVAGTQSGAFPDDFLTYRYAVNAANDGVNIYHHNITGPMLTAPNGADGQPFTYTPAALVALWPTTLFGWHTGWLLWDGAAMLVLGWVLTRFVPRTVPYRPAVIAAAIVAASLLTIVTKHIREGQINIFLMGLVLADLFRRDDTTWSRVLPRGALVGVAAAIKLTPGLFVVFFLITRQWRLVRGSVLGLVAATVIGALIYPNLTRTFLGGTLWSLTGKVDTHDDIGDPGNAGINGALHAAGSVGRDLVLPVVLVAALLVLLAAYRVQTAGRSVDAWLIVGLAAPVLSPVSWTHHFVYLLPAMTLLVLDSAAPRAQRIRNRAGVPIAAVALCWAPSTGDGWLHGDRSAWLVVPGLLQREAALLASIACVVALYLRGPVRQGKIRVAPEVGARATP